MPDGQTESLEEIARYHEGRIRLLESIAERQQSLLERLDAHMEEIRRDAAHMALVRQEIRMARRAA